MDSKFHLSSQYRVLHETLKTLSFEYGNDWPTIAGGYARDLAHGREPKDIDVVMVGFSKEGIDKVCDRLMWYYTITTFWARDDEDRLHCVVKVKVGGGTVDLLFWRAEKYKTVYQVLRDFDANINQYVINQAGNPMYVGESPEKVLVLVRDEELRQSRKTKVSSLCSDLGWEMPEGASSVLLNPSLSIGGLKISFGEYDEQTSNKS